MSWRNENDFGCALLREFLQSIRIDEHWLIDQPQGFTWWPSDLAQRVWCEPGVFSHVQTTYRLHAETDIIRGRGHAREYQTTLERDMDHITMSSLVYDQEADTFRLHASVFANEDNMTYLKRTFFSAVILQVREADQLARHLIAEQQATRATSAHPTAGLRPHPDPLLNAPEQFFCPKGKEASLWMGVPEWRETEYAIEREATKFTSDHQTHLTAEFPWTALPSQRGVVLDVTCREPHPMLGNGLHFTMSIPLTIGPDRVGQLAVELNQYERDN